jgi:outer membrane autotransporter protein
MFHTNFPTLPPGKPSDANLSFLNINTSGPRGFGIEVDGSTTKVNQTHIDTRGDGSAGLMVYRGSNVTFNNGVINTHGGIDTTKGEFVFPYSGASGVVVSSIFDHEHPGTDFKDTKVTMTNTTITTEGQGSHGVYAVAPNSSFDGDNITIQTKEKDAYGIAVVSGGSINLKNSQINTEGENAYGIFTSTLPSIETPTTEIITLDNTQIKTKQADGIHVAGGSNTTINLRNHSSIKGGNGVLLHVTKSGSGEVIKPKIVADGDVHLEGDMIIDQDDAPAPHIGTGASDSDEPDFIFRNKSTWKGATSSGGNYEFTDSTWEMTKSSKVDLLLLQQQSHVIFVHQPGGAFSQLTIDRLKGDSGIFDMHVNMGIFKGDFLNITGSSAGNYFLNITNEGDTPTDLNRTLPVVHTGDGIANFGLYNGKPVDVGAYKYNLYRGDGSSRMPESNDWYLAYPGSNGGGDGGNGGNGGNGGDGGSGGGNPPNPPPPPPSDGMRRMFLTNTANAAIGTFSAITSSWYDDLGTLVQRLGELRGEDQFNSTANGGEPFYDGKTAKSVKQAAPTFPEPEEPSLNDGLWLRVIGQGSRIHNNASRSFTQYTGGFQIGADHRVRAMGGSLYLGAFGGYLYNSRDFKDSGSGRGDTFSVGAYATWFHQSGWYVDLVGKYSYFWNQYNARTSNNSIAAGEYDVPGIGGSVEIGKRFDLSPHFFIEPQAQLAGVWVDSANYLTTTNYRVRADEQGSLRGRLGARFGTHIQINDKVAVEPYVVGSVIHEFLTGDAIEYAGTPFVSTLSGTSGQVGIGATAKLGQRMQAYAEYDYRNGDHVQQPWYVTTGVRWMW